MSAHVLLNLLNKLGKSRTHLKSMTKFWLIFFSGIYLSYDLSKSIII